MLMMLCATTVVAQRMQLGIEATGSVLLPQSTLSELPSFPTCCQQLDPTMGWGVSMRGVAMYPVSSSILLEGQLGLAYGQLGLARTEAIGYALDGTDDNARVVLSRTETDLSLNLLSVEPRALISWTLGASRMRPHVVGGLGAYIPVASRLRQAETLLEPSSAVFSDTRTQERLVVDTSLRGIISSWGSAQVGIGMYIPASDAIDVRMRLLAELPLTALARNGTSSLSLAAVRLDLMAGLRERSREVVPPPAVVPPTLELPLAVSVRLASPVSTTELSDTARVYIDERHDVDIHALLPFVFFEIGSASIPSRYAITNTDSRTFHERDVVHRERDRGQNMSARTIAVYHHILDIVGRRMRDEFPDAVLTVAGYVDDQGVERGNVKLARSRADVVATYLAAKWGVAASRINITAGVRSPTAAVTSMIDAQDRRDGFDENRRVELSSTNPAVLDPVVVADTVRSIELPAIVARIGVAGAKSGAAWSATCEADGGQVGFVKQGLLQDASVDGFDMHVSKLDSIDARANNPRHRVQVIRCTVRIEDSLRSAIATDKIPVQYDVRSRRQYSSDADSIESRFMLTQFEYGTGRMLSVQSSIIERFINPEITSRTAITITGFTDRKGDAQRNAELSVLRAREASANILGGAQRLIRGEGEAGDALQPPFTNELPETRLYNRTVEILLRTPIR